MSLNPRHRPFSILLGMALAAWLWSARAVQGADPSGPADGNAVPAADSPTSPASADDIQQWVKDLDSDIFASRQAAGRKLFGAGSAAIAPLAEAAGGKSLEVTTAAIDILRRISTTGDAAAQQAARAALDTIAQGESGSAASLAKEAIAGNNSRAAANPPPGIPNFGGNIQIMPPIGGNIQIFQGGGGVQVFRIQANAANGNRTVEVNDNGKKVKIQENQNGIEMKVTESLNGKEKIDTFKAKDAAELKKKFPEAAKLYDKYGQKQGGVIFGNVQLQAQAFPVFPPIMQPPVWQPMPAPNLPPQIGAGADIQAARKLISEATDGIKNAGAAEKPDAVKQAIAKLEDAGHKLDDAGRKLADGQK